MFIKKKQKMQNLMKIKNKLLNKMKLIFNYKIISSKCSKSYKKYKANKNSS